MAKQTPPTKYYHITNPVNLPTIFRDGLIANSDGQIFLFENKSIKCGFTINTVADCIASNQIALDEYAMIEVDSTGIVSEVVNDNVGEFSSSSQWIVTQPVIMPEHLEYFGLYKTEYKPFFGFAQQHQ